MIRPRTGDFVYSRHEMDVMLRDIKIFKQHGAQGIVAGVLKPSGSVDMDAMLQIVDASLPLEVCFHRAFDLTRDMKQALSEIEKIAGVTRILTSGQAPRVVDSLDNLSDLLDRSKLVTIMPGSGVTARTIPQIISALGSRGLKEVHMSGGAWKESEMEFRRDGFGMGASTETEWAVWQTDGASIEAVKRILIAADMR